MSIIWGFASGPGAGLRPFNSGPGFQPTGNWPGYNDDAPPSSKGNAGDPFVDGEINLSNDGVGVNGSIGPVNISGRFRFPSGDGSSNKAPDSIELQGRAPQAESAGLSEGTKTALVIGGLGALARMAKLI